jgi:hypothetical protein
MCKARGGPCSDREYVARSGVSFHLYAIKKTEKGASSTIILVRSLLLRSSSRQNCSLTVCTRRQLALETWLTSKGNHVY